MSEGVLDGRAEQQLDDVLARRALEVLEANWLGHGTRPSLLYPHQWSWDSACIAMGYARWNQPRAETELRSLFAGQWINGLLPHIVFAEGNGRYFPGPEFWQSERSRESPSGVKTSGIVQPPLHATAALRVYRQSADRERATSFLRELAPKLRAWHEYLYRERTRGDDGLVEIWHPWESGMDNSPLWDEALARLDPAKAQIPDYQRVDVELADPTERPTDVEYDRYVYLVGLFRELDYGADRIHDATPFALQPVLFNSLLVQANLDLAEIAQVLGDDPAPFEAWAEQTAVGASEWLIAIIPPPDNFALTGTRLGSYEIRRRPRRRRDGRGLPRARHQAQSRRRDQGPARAVRARPRAPRAVRARSADARGAQSSEHRADLRPRGWTDGAPRRW